MGVGGQRHDTADLPPPERPGSHCIGGWVAPEPVRTGAEYLAPTAIRSPDRPARSESLYQLRYPGSLQKISACLNTAYRWTGRVVRTEDIKQ